MHFSLDKGIQLAYVSHKKTLAQELRYTSSMSNKPNTKKEALCESTPATSYLQQEATNELNSTSNTLPTQAVVGRELDAESNAGIMYTEGLLMENYCVNCNSKFWSEGDELCTRCRSAISVACDEHEALRERAQIEAERES